MPTNTSFNRGDIVKVNDSSELWVIRISQNTHTFPFGMRYYMTCIEGLNYGYSQWVRDSFNTITLVPEYADKTACLICKQIVDKSEVKEIDNHLLCDACYDTNTDICADCGNRHLASDFEKVDGERICSNCRHDHYTRCECCDRWFRNDSDSVSYYDSIDANICDDCLSNSPRLSYCDNCEELMWSNCAHDVYSDEDRYESWCEDCVDNHAYYCEECGNYYTSDVRFYNDICEYCAEGEHEPMDIADWSAPQGIRDYYYKPRPCFLPEYDADTIYIGTELEVEHHGSTCRDIHKDADMINEALGFSYCKHDGSLSEDGIEIVTHPATFDYYMSRKDEITALFKRLSDLGYTSHNNRNCGLHFHISLFPFIKKNEYAVHNLIILVDTLWDKLVRFSRRTESQLDQWARRYNTKYDKCTNVYDRAKSHRCRYMAVNLENSHTVEIRMMRGSINPETFFATLQLIQRLIEVCITITDPEEARTYTWEKLIESDYAELKSYCERRFAPTEAPGAIPNDEPEVNTNSDWINWSEERMHNANFAVGDAVICGSGCNDHYRGRCGVIETLFDSGACTLSVPVANSSIVEHPSSHLNVLDRVERPLRVGDYVRVRNIENTSFSIPDENESIGRIVTISGNSCLPIGVDFGRSWSGHGLNGRCPQGHGQWVPTRACELI